MKNEIEKYELIEKFLQGNLRGVELKQVLNRIQTDADFAREVKKHRELHNLIFERELIGMKDAIKAIHINNSTNAGGRKGLRNMFFFVGALIITVLLVTIISIRKSNKNENSIHEMSTELKSVSDSSIVISDNTSRVNQVNYKNKAIKPALVSMVDSATVKDISTTSSKETGLNLMQIQHKSTLIQKPEEQPEIKVETTLPDDKSNFVSKKVTDCENINIEAQVDLESSCDDKPTGKIRVDEQSIEGGTPPYTISVDGGKNYITGLLAGNLSPANYFIFIKDTENCFNSLGNFLINTIECSYEFVFSPDKGEVWRVPLQDLTGEIKIYNIQGKLVYESIYDMPGEYEWDGRTNSGSELPMGAYSFVVKLSNNELIRGNVTIVR